MSSELPKGWCKTDFDRLMLLMRNGTNESQNTDGIGIPVSRIETIATGAINIERVRHIANPREQLLRDYLLIDGDILFSHINSVSHLGKAALYREGMGPLLHGMNLMLMRVNHELIDPGLFKYLCDYYRAIGRFSSIAQHAVNQASLNQKRLKSVELDLPPLNEQRRIVGKIEELFSDLDAGVAALERARANLKRYRSAVLKAAVEGRLTAPWRADHPDVEPASTLLTRILQERRTRWEADQLAKYEAKGKQPPKDWRDRYEEPAPPDTTELPDLPPKWCWATVGMILTIRGGFAFKSGDYCESGIPLVRQADLKERTVDTCESKRLPRTFESEYSDYLIHRGDVLISMSGSLGKVAVYEDDSPALQNQRTGLLEVSPLIPPETASLALRSVEAQLRRKGKGIAVQNVSASDIEECIIPLAPLPEQHAASSEIARHESVIDVLAKCIASDILRSARLRQSILKRAFEGKLVPQDPRDEPASELLARLHSNAEQPASRKRSAGSPRKTKGKP